MKPKSKPHPKPAQPAPDLDRAAVDPRAILEAIANDPSIAPYVRVHAAKALLAAAETTKAKVDHQDAVTALALDILRRKK